MEMSNKGNMRKSVHAFLCTFDEKKRMENVVVCAISTEEEK